VNSVIDAFAGVDARADFRQTMPAWDNPVHRDADGGAMAQGRAQDRPVIVFDLGGVLIDWNPRHLYRKLFDDEVAMERFLEEVCHGAWNLEQDRGRSFADAIEEAALRYPYQRSMIEAYHTRWDEMLAGPIEGSVAILEELAAAGCELHALTNWSAETFPIARPRFAFLDRFETILVSGDERLVKPDARIFQLLLERIAHPAQRCIYIDDSPPNVAAAAALGFDAIPFTSPSALRAALAGRGLLVAPEVA
jgi:2-haloacid dehalogenase